MTEYWARGQINFWMTHVNSYFSENYSEAILQDSEAILQDFEAILQDFEAFLQDLKHLLAWDAMGGPVPCLTIYLNKHLSAGERDELSRFCWFSVTLHLISEALFSNTRQVLALNGRSSEVS